MLAGIILSTNLMFDVTARAATPDSVLIFCGSVALWLYVMGTFAPWDEPDPMANAAKPRVRGPMVSPKLFCRHRDVRDVGTGRVGQGTCGIFAADGDYRNVRTDPAAAGKKAGRRSVRAIRLKRAIRFVHSLCGPISSDAFPENVMVDAAR